MVTSPLITVHYGTLRYITVHYGTLRVHSCWVGSRDTHALLTRARCARRPTVHSRPGAAAGRSDLVESALTPLRAAFAEYARGGGGNGALPGPRAIRPLLYDATWGGIVSGDGVANGLDGDKFVDFGNAFYNDHHFQFG